MLVMLHDTANARQEVELPAAVFACLACMTADYLYDRHGRVPPGKCLWVLEHREGPGQREKGALIRLGMLRSAS